MTIRSVQLESYEHAVLVILGSCWNSSYSGTLEQRALHNGEMGIAMHVLASNHFEIRFSSGSFYATNEGFELSYEPTSGANL